MFIQQIYTNCLAHAAYYIESGNEAAVIDPLRDYNQYAAIAEARGATIKYIFETHFHADFVSGHIDLAEKTGGVIVFGPGATPGYKAYIAEDGEIMHLGDTKLEVLHTPGHTVESICVLLYDEQGRNHAVFTGDTLFAGDVGRPDLMSGNHLKEELAAMLFDSLQTKLKTLPADTLVYPGHGAGSACGKNISSKSFSTIEDELDGNYAMRIDDKDEFIKAVTADLPHVPGYFFTDAGINKKGYKPFDEVIADALVPLTMQQFSELHNAGAIILDTRRPMVFAKGCIPGAINIGLTGDFAVWVGTLITPGANIVLVAEPGKEKEAIERLARIGYESVQGYMQNGMADWLAADKYCDRITTYAGKECEALLDTTSYQLLDVRNRREVAKHRMIGATHIPLNELKVKMGTLDKNVNWLIYCAGGYRSMIAASLLRSGGFEHVASVEGGIQEILSTVPQLVEMPDNDTE